MDPEGLIGVIVAGEVDRGAVGREARATESLRQRTADLARRLRRPDLLQPERLAALVGQVCDALAVGRVDEVLGATFATLTGGVTVCSCAGTQAKTSGSASKSRFMARHDSLDPHAHRRRPEGVEIESIAFRFRGVSR